MKKIHRPAWHTSTGKVVVAPRPGMRHVEILGGTGQRGFVTTDGEFVGRKEAAEIAKKAGQCGPEVNLLHSEDLPEYKRKKG